MESPVPTKVVVSFELIFIYADYSIVDHHETPTKFIRQRLLHQQIPVRHEEKVAYADHSDTYLDQWIVGPRPLASSDPPGLPSDRRAAGVLVRSPALLPGRDNLRNEIERVFDVLTSLNLKEYAITTSKHCQLRINVGVHEHELQLSSVLNISLMATAFEHCLDPLMALGHIKGKSYGPKFDLSARLSSMPQAGSFAEFSSYFNADDSSLVIQNQSSVTFQGFQGSLDADEAVFRIWTILTLFEYCCYASLEEIQDLIIDKIYDITFSTDDVLATIQAHPEIRKYWAARLEPNTPSPTPDLRDLSTSGTACLALTTCLRKLESSKRRAQDPCEIRRAMTKKYFKGLYGTDLLIANDSRPLFLNPGDDNPIPQGSMDFIAESIEQDTAEASKMAGDLNDLAMEDVSNTVGDDQGMGDEDDDGARTPYDGDDEEPEEEADPNDEPTAQQEYRCDDDDDDDEEADFSDYGYEDCPDADASEDEPDIEDVDLYRVVKPAECLTSSDLEDDPATPFKDPGMTREHLEELERGAQAERQKVAAEAERQKVAGKMEVDEGRFDLRGMGRALPTISLEVEPRMQVGGKVPVYTGGDLSQVRE